MSPRPDHIHCLICYDVSDDRRRTRLAHRLEADCDRVQLSVFEGWLEPASLDTIIDEIVTLIDPEEDTVTIMRLCAACLSQRQVLGRGTEDPLPGHATVLIV